MYLLFSSSDAARDPSNPLSLLLLKVRKAVEAVSSLALQVQMLMGLQHLTTLLLQDLLSFRFASA